MASNYIDYSIYKTAQLERSLTRKSKPSAEFKMQKGDKVQIMRNGDISQSYVPWGSYCRFISIYDRYVCVEYDNEEMLIHKDLVVELKNEDSNG